MTIKFHRKLYTQKNIRAALKQFSGFGLTEAGSKRSYYCVDLDESPEAEHLRDEFRNYVLYLELTHENR